VEAAAAGGSFPACGDGAVNVAGEQCDGGDLAGATCASLGYTLGGTLGCGAGCGYDTSGCESQAFPATGQTTCWTSAGAVIPCAGTGHDGEVQAGAMLAYVDNGDGTVSDANTGLMWEKLSDDGSIHDKDTVFIWDDAFVKVATLNSGSFAGYTDWRVPTVKELQSIVNYENVVPSREPCLQHGLRAGLHGSDVQLYRFELLLVVVYLRGQSSVRVVRVLRRRLRVRGPQERLQLRPCSARRLVIDPLVIC
jgi:hypothetical protein